MHFLGAKNSGNSKGGEKSLDMGWGKFYPHTQEVSFNLVFSSGFPLSVF